jgi:hypothetical protein
MSKVRHHESGYEASIQDRFHIQFKIIINSTALELRPWISYLTSLSLLTDL